MRKLKQLCREYRQYENLHNGKILIFALQQQIRQRPKGTQIRFLKKSAKSYFRENYPSAFDEMTEKDWDDVSKRLSYIWNTTKNEDPIFEADVGFMYLDKQNKPVIKVASLDQAEQLLET